jgi:hypothetical protein
MNNRASLAADASRVALLAPRLAGASPPKLTDLFTDGS